MNLGELTSLNRIEANVIGCSYANSVIAVEDIEGVVTTYFIVDDIAEQFDWLDAEPDYCQYELELYATPAPNMFVLPDTVITRTGLQFHENARTLVTQIEMAVDGKAGALVTVELGAQSSPIASVVWSDPIVYTVGETVKLNCRHVAQYTAVRFTTDADVSINAVDLTITPAGGRRYV